MTSRSRLSYQSIEAKGGLFARKKATVKRQLETRITAQQLWETFESSKDPIGDILDLVDRTYRIAFTKFEVDTASDWSKVEKLLKFAFDNIPQAVRDLRDSLEPTINEYMRGDVRSVTAAQVREIDDEIRSAKAVVNYLLRVLKELNGGVESFLQKDTITMKEYHALAKDISASIRSVKASMRKEFGGVYSLSQPLKPLSESQIPRYRSKGSRSRSRSSDNSSSSRRSKSASIQSIARSASPKGWGKYFYRKK
jgi:hypothetical protein